MSKLNTAMAMAAASATVGTIEVPCTTGHFLFPEEFFTQEHLNAKLAEKTRKWSIDEDTKTSNELEVVLNIHDNNGVAVAKRHVQASGRTKGLWRVVG